MKIILFILPTFNNPVIEKRLFNHQLPFILELWVDYLQGVNLINLSNTEKPNQFGEKKKAEIAPTSFLDTN